MASSENLASLDQWMFRPATFADSWISEAFARDTETLTRALQKSLSDHNSGSIVSDSISPFFNLVNQPETPTAARTPSVSGSDAETAAAPSPRRRSSIPVATSAAVKGGKRKSRASKRSTTTFIMADPANFRQMVQQVTGIKFGGGQMSVAPLLKPEPQRPVGNRLTGCLPTLDTSAFLLDHNRQAMVGPTQAAAAMATVLSGPSPPQAVADGGGSGFDFDAFSSFPTLESWKVM